MSINIANLLTLSRLILVPFYILCFVLGLKTEAFIIFCVAGFTDLIDGTVARFCGSPSKIGALMDPIADKLLMQSAFLSLAAVSVLPWWFFCLAFVRDAVIISGIFYLKFKKINVEYNPAWVSKFSTLMQITVVVLGLIYWWQNIAAIAPWFITAVYVSAGLIVISWINYVIIGVRLVKKDRKQTA